MPQSSNPTTHQAEQEEEAFCHTFDLTKRLTIPSSNPLNIIPISTSTPNPFPAILHALQTALSASPNTVHRILLPTLLSPALYPPSASLPKHLLPFLHALRALLRQSSSNTVLFLSIPLSLYPRSTGLLRSIELLTDGILELSPFPSHTHSTTLASSGAATKDEEKPQGMLKLHRLPVFHERGGGGGRIGGGVDLGEDLAFTLSRRKLVVKPFSLPPMEGDTDAQQQQQGGGAGGGEGKAKDMEF